MAHQRNHSEKVCSVKDFVFSRYGQTVIMTEQIIPEDALRKVIADTGYTVTVIQTGVYQCKELFGLF